MAQVQMFRRMLRIKADGVSRREFLTLIGAGAPRRPSAPRLGPTGSKHTSPEELERWKKALMQAASPLVYRSGVHTDARMHLGGIGTGNIEIGCDGQFTRWQLFNTLSDGQVPLMFAVKAGDKTRLLQTAGGPDWPRVKEIELKGEYPIATLRFNDDDLPVSWSFRPSRRSLPWTASSLRCRWRRWCSK